MAVSSTGSVGTSNLSSILSAMRDKLFQKADTDKNDAISLDEFISAGKKVPGGKKGPATGGIDESRAKELFSKIDTNADGSASKDEVSAFQQKLVNELQAAMTQLQELLGKELLGNSGQKPDENAIKDKGGHHHHAPPPPLSEVFGKIDADSNSTISKSEFTDFGKTIGAFGKTIGADDAKSTERSEKLFAKIDTNADGSLSQDEVSVFDESMKAKREAEQSGKNVQLSALLEAMNAYGSKKSKQAQASANTTASALQAAQKAV